MDREELLNAASEWSRQDRENRSIVVILREYDGKEEAYISSRGVVGMPNNIIASLINALNNDSDLDKFLAIAQVSRLAEKSLGDLIEPLKNKEEKQDECSNH